MHDTLNINKLHQVSTENIKSIQEFLPAFSKSDCASPTHHDFRGCIIDSKHMNSYRILNHGRYKI